MAPSTSLANGDLTDTTSVANRIVEESDSAHGWGKFAGAFGVETLAGLGAAKLAKWAGLFGKGVNAADKAADTAKTVNQVNKVAEGTAKGNGLAKEALGNIECPTNGVAPKSGPSFKT
ncbi:hypothetical protein DTL42_13480 [Bremerella cremea]|uniref:Uncharacterized protein n=1 Tax=Bremerella cremea TaxID=1031537 RepID=A0A368KQH0_9BACT|nr:hypothetical protein [Bremerella cremea]RCS48329.1 hypothetical protein DTL42_13480 [Bremerella cremea]